MLQVCDAFLDMMRKRSVYIGWTFLGVPVDLLKSEIRLFGFYKLKQGLKEVYQWIENYLDKDFIC